ncbi:MAG TPA: AAA family ATPase [Thermoplasmata archaeon]|nr:AAA family ATPase [Thermoplasmata archaeon]
MSRPERRRALLVTGMPGAGKSEFVGECARAGLKSIGMGDAVRSEAALAGVQADKIGEFASAERERHGVRIWAKRTLTGMGPGAYVVDGLRSEEELREFRDRLGDDLVVVGIHASRATRLARLAGRGRGDDAEDFDRRDARELGWGVGNVIALTDVLIENESSMDELRSEARKLAARLLG